MTEGAPIQEAPFDVGGLLRTLEQIRDEHAASLETSGMSFDTETEEKYNSALAAVEAISRNMKKTGKSSKEAFMEDIDYMKRRGTLKDDAYNFITEKF